MHTDEDTNKGSIDTLFIDKVDDQCRVSNRWVTNNVFIGRVIAHKKRLSTYNHEQREVLDKYIFNVDKINGDELSMGLSMLIRWTHMK